MKKSTYAYDISYSSTNINVACCGMVLCVIFVTETWFLASPAVLSKIGVKCNC